MPKTELPGSLPLESLLAAVPEGCTIDRHEIHGHTLELFVTWPEPKGTDLVCPHCGSCDCTDKGKGSLQTIRHVNTGLMGTLITFRKPRFVCRDCGRSFYARPKWVFPDMSVSSFVALQIFDELTCTGKSLSMIARDTFTSPAIVTSLLERIPYRAPKKLPVSLGIDEFKGNSGYWDPKRKRFCTEKYHCVLVDADAGRVIDILLKATYQELHDYFMEFSPDARKRVRFFCTDMRSGFSKVARVCFPRAKICIDMFHVVKLVTGAVGDVRLSAWHSLVRKYRSALTDYEEAKKAHLEDLPGRKAAADLLKDQCDLVKGSQRVLITSPYHEDAYWNRDPEKRSKRLKELFELEPQLEFAHTALMEFYDILETTEFNDKRSNLTAWLAKYTVCDCPPIRQAAYSINRHRKGIENSWKYHKSNGVTESLNQKTKNIIRASFGMRSFEHLRKRILLASGATVLDMKNPYTIFGEKRGDEASDHV